MVPRKGFRWEIIALSAVLTLAVLSLAYYSYERAGVRRPLEKALLTDPDVSDVSISDGDSGLTIEVSLSKVSDLSATYKRINDLIVDRVDQKGFVLWIKDQRNAELLDMYHAAHYYLEEASVRGNFGTMIETCGPILDNAGATAYKITVDQKHIYVQIESENGYFYQVLDRPNEIVAGGGT